MAIHAGKHPSVNRMLELGLIDKEADRLAVDFGGQGCIGVAGKAVGVLRLALGAGRGGAGEQRENNKLGENSSARLGCFASTSSAPRPPATSAY